MDHVIPRKVNLNISDICLVLSLYLTQILIKTKNDELYGFNVLMICWFFAIMTWTGIVKLVQYTLNIF